MIFKINNTTYIRFNEDTKVSETIDLTELEARKAELESELKVKSDEELLAWAKANYFTPEIIAKIERDNHELEKIELVLNEIYG
jgi:hypothetical protein